MVRVVGTGLRPLSGTSHEVTPSDVTPRMLALASRPAAALWVPDPVDAPAPGTACRGTERRGRLEGSPWDPRVAWIGTTEVTWPVGYAAIFVPELRLLDPQGQMVAAAGDDLRLVGAVSGVEGGSFEACAVQQATPGEP